MKTLLLCALVPLAGFLPQDAVRIAFEAAPGSSTRKFVRAVHTLNAESSTRVLGENDPVVTPMGVRLDSKQVMRVVDEYQAVGDGRPTRLLRTYNGGSLDASLGFPENPEAEGPSFVLESPIVETSVAYTWIPEEGSYARYYDAKELPERWLPQLRADLDCLSLLPAGAVAVGESWEVDPRALVPILAPFGDQQFDPAPGAPMLLVRSVGAGMGGNLQRVLDDAELRGQIVLTLESVEDGLARVSIRVARLSVVADMSDYTSENRLRSEAIAQQAAPESSRLTLDLTGRGELQWNLGAGRVQDLELTLAETLVMSLRSEFQGQPMVDEIRMSGTLVQTLRTRDVEAEVEGTGD